MKSFAQDFSERSEKNQQTKPNVMLVDVSSF